MIRYLFALVVPLLIFGFMEVFIVDHLNIDSRMMHIAMITYGIIALFGYLGLLLGFRYWRISPLNRSRILNFLIGFGFASVVMKVALFIILILYGVLVFIFSFFIESASSQEIVLVLFLLSLAPFIALIYGMLWGKYRFQLEKVDLVFPDLPDAFDGFKIVQISDAHSGTWDRIAGVEKGIKLIEAQDADMIVFTGDLVNADQEEVRPFMPLFERLKAPYGKFAILGNHDYYGQPKEKELRPAYYDNFYRKFREMNFDLILNDSREILKDGQLLRLIGVENWGSGRFFPKRGDLNKATKECSNGDFSILLSHDPSHWDQKALEYPHHFHLTLSGHTHGMQFGINLPFFKWSPVKYRYQRWMGLYQQSGQYLYVNRGFGVLGYPGRVGMSPEVTLIKLRKQKL